MTMKTIFFLDNSVILERGRKKINTQTDDKKKRIKKVLVTIPK